MFSRFVSKNIPAPAPVAGALIFHVERNKALFMKIAEGELNLWDRDSPATAEVRLTVLEQYGPIFSSNQAAE
jgi:hypothetical protein